MHTCVRVWCKNKNNWYMYIQFLLNNIGITITIKLITAHYRTSLYKFLYQNIMNVDIKRK